MNILVTGAAGFIGFHLTKKLLEQDFNVIGVDNLNNYYNPDLKNLRLQRLKEYKNFLFFELDILDNNRLRTIFNSNKIDYVFHMAAQAGVRYSMKNPLLTMESNVMGFTNVLSISAENNIKHFFYASSSSVYGEKSKIPFNENSRTDYPISLYAASKKANELIAYSYFHNYKIGMTGLRFFTVYGPWGRPDMAYYQFAEKISKGEQIELYNNGNMKRDFTYIDDVIGIIFALVKEVYDDENLNDHEDFRIINVGCNNPVEVKHLISFLEEELQMGAKIINKPAPAVDTQITSADISFIEKNYNYKPEFTLRQGIKVFIAWYKEFNNING